MLRKLYKYITNRHWSIKLIASVMVGLLILYFIFAFIVSRLAGGLFNQVIAGQHMIKGNVRVEALSANVLGKVSFENLEWTDEEGDQVLQVPEGYIQVRVFDLLTDLVKGHVGASVIGEIHLEGATIYSDFDDTMRVDVVAKEKRQKLASTKTRADKERDLEKRIRNLDWQGQFINATLYLEDCVLDIQQRNRHYRLTDVDAEIRLNTHRFVKIDLTSGKFTGDAIGDGLRIKGTIDLSKLPKAMPTLNLDLDTLAVDPGSLGFGNVHDTMTLKTHWNGPLSAPEANGTLVMPILRIPALTFTNLTGQVHYENGLMTFSNVEADVFAGRLRAQGTYNIDTRAYTIKGEARRLISSEALQNPDFDVFVNARINMESDGRKEHTHVYGDFDSSPGRYFLAPIESITGRFDNLYKTTSFYDVMIRTRHTAISTEALTIEKGKLTLGHINILLGNGSQLDLKQSDIESDLVALERAKNSWPGMGENMRDIKDNLDDMKDGQEEIGDVMKQSKSLKSSLDGLKHTLDGLSDTTDTWHQ